MLLKDFFLFLFKPLFGRITALPVLADLAMIESRESWLLSPIQVSAHTPQQVASNFAATTLRSTIRWKRIRDAVPDIVWRHRHPPPPWAVPAHHATTSDLYSHAHPPFERSLVYVDGVTTTSDDYDMKPGMRVGVRYKNPNGILQEGRFHNLVTYFPGEIVNARREGTFDVKHDDDGSVEARVPASRLKPLVLHDLLKQTNRKLTEKNRVGMFVCSLAPNFR